MDVGVWKKLIGVDDKVKKAIREVDVCGWIRVCKWMTVDVCGCVWVWMKVEGKRECG